MLVLLLVLESGEEGEVEDEEDETTKMFSHFLRNESFRAYPKMLLPSAPRLRGEGWVRGFLVYALSV